MTKKYLTYVVCCLTVLFIGAAAQTSDNEPLKYRGAMGFADGSDKIAGFEFVKDGSKLVVIGETQIQIWDAKELKLIRSIPHTIDQFAPSKGFFSKYILLGIPKLLRWRPYVVDPNGKWLATIERSDIPNIRTVVVRDLQELNKINELKLDGYSANYISYDEARDQVVGEFKKGKSNAYVSWDAVGLAQTKVLVIDDYKWHKEIKDGKKVIVGSGDSKFVANLKQGDTLTLRDVATGKIETVYSADGLKPETPFQETEVVANETLLVSKRDDRLFVWDIDGDGKPKIELPVGNPKNTYNYRGVLNDRFIHLTKDNSLYIYDLIGNSDRPEEFRPTSKDRPYPADISKDGRFIAVQEAERARVFEIGKNDPVLSIVRDSPNERLRGIAFVEELGVFAIGRVNNKEKKPFRTELFDLADFKLTRSIARWTSPSYRLIKEDKFFLDTGIGYASIFDIEGNRSISFELNTSTTYCSSDDTNCTSETFNTERLSLNGDETLAIKTGDRVTSVWDLNDGKLLQNLLLKDRAKYDKKNVLKESGVVDVKWSDDSSFVYGVNQTGTFSNTAIRTIHVWDVVK